MKHLVIHMFCQQWSCLEGSFKIKDTQLDFACVVHVAIETKDAEKVAKEMVYRFKTPGLLTGSSRARTRVNEKNCKQPYTTNTEYKCYRYGIAHKVSDCSYEEVKCHFCDKKGHLEAVCRKKQWQQREQKRRESRKQNLSKQSSVVTFLGWVCQSQSRTDSSQGTEHYNNGKFQLFVNLETTRKPKLEDVRQGSASASKHDLPVLETFMDQTKDPKTGKQSLIPYILIKIPDLNLMGWSAI